MTRINKLLIVPNIQFELDGVADYAFTLLKKCSASAITALNHNAEPQGEGYNVYNLTNCKIWDKVKKVRMIIKKHKIEEIEIQLSSFGYHYLGFAFFPLFFLKFLTNIRISTMVHEMWPDPVNKRQAFHFWLIKLNVICILKFVTNYKVYTSNNLYVKRLRKINIHAQLKPIHSNIEFNKDPNLRLIPNLLKENGINSKPVIFLFFGTIYDNWDYKKLINYIKLKNINEPLFIHVGVDRHQNMVLNRIKEIRVLFLGKLTSNDISSIMQSVDYGVTTNPELLIPKSGTASAFFAHDLPVLTGGVDVYKYEGKIEDIHKNLIRF